MRSKRIGGDSSDSRAQSIGKHIFCTIEMRRFGLVGKSLQHSQSLSHFTEKFQREGIADASYALFELLDIDQWSEWISAEEKNRFSA